MWISEPTPVISSTKQMDSWSSRRPSGTWNLPTSIHWKIVSSRTRCTGRVAEHLHERGHAVGERQHRHGHAEQVPPGVSPLAPEQQDGGAEQRERKQQPGGILDAGGVQRRRWRRSQGMRHQRTVD